MGFGTLIATDQNVYTPATPVALGITPTQQSILVLLTTAQTTSGAVTSVTGGGTWAHVPNSDFNAGGIRSDVWVCLNATGGSTSLTITGQSGGTPEFVFAEFSRGGFTASVTDNAVGASGSGGVDSSGNLTPTWNNQNLVIGTAAFASVAPTPGPGWTAALMGGTTWLELIQYQVVNRQSGSFPFASTTASTPGAGWNDVVFNIGNGLTTKQSLGQQGRPPRAFRPGIAR